MPSPQTSNPANPYGSKQRVKTKERNTKKSNVPGKTVTLKKETSTSKKEIFMPKKKFLRQRKMLLVK